MTRHLAALALFASGCLALHAQQTPVTASTLSYKGVPIASGYVTLTPQTPGNTGYQVAITGTGGFSFGPLMSTVTNGAIATGFAVPDQCLNTAVTANTPWGYLVQVVDTAITPNVAITWYIPPTPPAVCGTTPFQLDHYTSTQAPVYISGYTHGPASQLPPHVLPGALYNADDTHVLYSGGSDGVLHAIGGSGGGGVNLSLTTVGSGAATYNSTTGVLNIPTASGIAGPAGPAGPAGINGTNGTNGAPGAAATIAVGSTTTGAAGSQASVTNVGSSSAAVLNFTIPQGVAGTGGSSGVSSFNTRTGAVTPASGDYAANQITGLAPVATSNSYTDLTNKPTIPTNNNQLTNGAGFITSSQADPSGAAAAAIASSVQKTSNLSDLASASAARTNLGLATVASSGSASDLGAGTLPNARLSAVPNAALANPCITLNGSSVCLGGTATVGPAGADATKNAQEVDRLGSSGDSTCVLDTSAPYQRCLFTTGWKQAFNGVAWLTMPLQVAAGNGLSLTTTASTNTVTLANTGINTDYLSASDTTTSQGGTTGAPVSGYYLNMLDNVPSTNMGFGLGNCCYMRNVHALNQDIVVASPGIFEANSMSMASFTNGDRSAVARAYLNWVPGKTAWNDEGHKVSYVYYNPITSYKATISSVVSVNELRTTNTDACGQQASKDSNCSGPERQLVNISAGAIYTGNVLSLTPASFNNYGVLAVDTPISSSLITPGHGNIAAGIPELGTGNSRVAGETLTFTWNTLTGRLPNVGEHICASGGYNYVAAETMTVSAVSGSSVTVSDHRYPHTLDNGAPAVDVFVGACNLVNSVNNEGVSHSKYNVAWLAALDSTHIAYAAVDGGARNSPSFGTGGTQASYPFAPGIAGRDGITAWRSAMVLSTSDPAITSAQKLAGVSDHTGYLRIGAYDGPAFAASGTVEEALNPANNVVMNDQYMYPNTPGSGGSNNFSHREINQNVGILDDIRLENPHRLTKAGNVNRAGTNTPYCVPNTTDCQPYGALPTLRYIGVDNVGDYGSFDWDTNYFVAPKSGFNNIQTCQGGPDAEGDCTSDRPYYLYTWNKNGDGITYNGNPTYTEGGGYTGRFLAFSFPKTFFYFPADFQRGLYIGQQTQGGVPVTLSEGDPGYNPGVNFGGGFVTVPHLQLLDATTAGNLLTVNSMGDVSSVAPFNPASPGPIGGGTPSTVTATIYQETMATPASSSATCTAGQFTDDANFHYVCVSTNTWKRVALNAF